VDTSAVSAKGEALAAEASISTPSRASDPAADTTSNSGSALKSTEFVTISPGLLSFGTNQFNVTQQLNQLLRTVPHVDSLILAIRVDVVELTEHANEGQVRSGIVDNTFRSVFNEEFKKLETL
ncbi:hypothetical protein KUX60_23865, partial [Salmonella enterica subsp. enterica serovar Kentucky]|nr:hypothetical protein [Salmonella enterica subsp. enterica serovar Kentucky]